MNININNNISSLQSQKQLTFTLQDHTHLNDHNAPTYNNIFLRHTSIKMDFSRLIGRIWPSQVWKG